MTFTFQTFNDEIINLTNICIANEAVEWQLDKYSSSYDIIEGGLHGCLLKGDYTLKERKSTLIFPIKIADTLSFEECINLISPIEYKLQKVINLIIDNTWYLPTYVTDFNFEWEQGCFMRLGRLVIHLLHDDIYMYKNPAYEYPFQFTAPQTTLVVSTTFPEIPNPSTFELYFTTPTKINGNIITNSIRLTVQYPSSYHTWPAIIDIDLAGKSSPTFATNVYFNSKENIAHGAILGYPYSGLTAPQRIPYSVSMNYPNFIFSGCTFTITVNLNDTNYTVGGNGKIICRKRVLL